MPVRHPSKRPGMGTVPYRGGTAFRVWAPHAEPVRHRHVRRMGHGRDAARPRRDGTTGFWSADVKGSRPAPSASSRSGRPTVTCRDRPLRAPGHDVGRQLGRVRQHRASTGATTTSSSRAGTSSSSTSSTSGRSLARPTSAARSTSRPTARVPAEARRVGGPGDAASSSPATSAGATTRPTCSRSRARTAGRRVQGFIRDAHAHGSRSSSTSSTTTSGRRTSTCGGSTAGPRATAAGSTSTTTSGADAVGHDPPRLRPRRGPVLPPRQRAHMARGVPVRRPAVRCDRPHPDGRRARARRVGEGWSFMPWVNDEIDTRQPWKLTIAEDHQV